MRRWLCYFQNDMLEKENDDGSLVCHEKDTKKKDVTISINRVKKHNETMKNIKKMEVMMYVHADV